MDKAMKLLKKNWYYLAGGAVGGIGGFLYWYFVGCAKGTCPITSSPVMSTIWGALMGGLLFSVIFADKKRKTGNAVTEGQEHDQQEEKTGC
ncbi:MAG: hypothetical protein FWC45_02490 [Treponema sp.]|nr:hypothetical protein [Treponema sp.]